MARGRRHAGEKARGGPGATLRVRQIRSGIGFQRKQKETLRSLGLGRLNRVVELPDNAAVRGMIDAVCHLVEIL